MLLRLDNHQSHINLEAIDFAKKHGIVLLSFPSHSSHKLQPFDKAVYGPFKRYYNNACDCWMKENRGTTISIYGTPDMVGRGFPRAFTPLNIQSGFKITVIYLFNPDIFTDAEFLLSDVADRLIPVDVVGGVSKQLADQQATSQQHQKSDMSSPSRTDYPTIVTPESIRSFTKAAPRKRKSYTNRGKTKVLTDTPEKMNLWHRLEKRKRQENL